MKIIEVKSTFFIQDGDFKFVSGAFKQKVEDFKAVNEGAYGEAIFRAYDRVEYFQHKYYRGFLLPDVAFAMGEKDVAMVHLELKKEFLIRPVQVVDDIPKKYLRKGIFFLKDGYMVTKVPSRLVQGCVLLFDHADNLYAYVPSTADLSFDEMKEFTEKVEHRLFVDLAGQLGSQGRDAKEAFSYRDIAYPKEDE